MPPTSLRDRDGQRRRPWRLCREKVRSDRDLWHGRYRFFEPSGVHVCTRACANNIMCPAIEEFYCVMRYTNGSDLYVTHTRATRDFGMFHDSLVANLYALVVSNRGYTPLPWIDKRKDSITEKFRHIERAIVIFLRKICRLSSVFIFLFRLHVP